MTCSKCNRALNPGDHNESGECVICAPPAAKFTNVELVGTDEDLKPSTPDWVRHNIQKRS